MCYVRVGGTQLQLMFCRSRSTSRINQRTIAVPDPDLFPLPPHEPPPLQLAFQLPRPRPRPLHPPLAWFWFIAAGSSSASSQIKSDPNLNLGDDLYTSISFKRKAQGLGYHFAMQKTKDVFFVCLFVLNSGKLRASEKSFSVFSWRGEFLRILFGSVSRCLDVRVDGVPCV